MKRITATEFKNNMGAFSRIAMREPVFINSRQRGCLVLLSEDEYRRLTDGVAEGVSAERRRLIRERADYHRDTLLGLADR